MKYFALFTVIILSTLKVAVIAAGLFLNDIFILFDSFLIDIIHYATYQQAQGTDQ